MDRRPIGVFDSGLGGLTAVRELMRLLPHEDIIYFGDTGRVPYGTRSRETILRYTRQDIAFLTGFSIKALVVACGTASSVALPTIKDDYDFPILGVVKNAAVRAAEATRNGKIGVIGTRATIQSGAFDRELSDFSLSSVVCPLFVPLVENGRVTPGDPVLKLVIEEYLTPLRERSIDTLILGCTHYPIIAEAIANFLPGVTLVNPGFEAIRTLSLRGDFMQNPAGAGSCHFYVSDDPAGFAENASLFLGRPVEGLVSQVSIEEYL